LNHHPLGIFDSGIGGISVARAIISRLPNESFLYFGDTAHVPYGPHPRATIQRYSESITEFLLSHSCKAIVVACNTATTAAIEYLRQKWPDVPFIGMEPAVKPGAKATKTGKVAVLATAGTFKSQRYSSLMQRFASGVELLENPCIGLVERIEQGQTEGDELENFLRPIVLPMQEAGADTFVLGCTHYPFIQPVLRKLLGEEVAIIDPAPALARHLESVLKKRELLAPQQQTPHYQLMASGPAKQLESLAEKMLGFPVQAEGNVRLAHSNEA
jgi:glutamate racemase